MTAPNPFRTRHSETAARDVRLFTSSFGPEILSVVPPPPFDQFYVVRSAPGAGKTSMMKALTAPMLRHVHEHRTRLAYLHTFLSDFGLLDDDGPRVLGVLENLNQGYAGFADIAVDPPVRDRLLFRLIDARVMQGVVRAALTVAGVPEEADPGLVEIKPSSDAASRALDRLGGSTGQELLALAEEAEDALLDLFDELVVRESTIPRGHARLYSMTALTGADIFVAGEKLRARPLIMLDDGHALAPSQRKALLAELADRTVDVGRWLAIRSVSMSDDELLGAGDEGRDFDVIEIEALARERTSAGSAAQRLTGQTLTHHRFRKMLLDIADKRAVRVLDRMLPDNRTLTDLLTVEPDSTLGSRGTEVCDELRSRLVSRGGNQGRYADWIDGATQLEGRDGVARLAELDVLIQRDARRTQGDLFSDYFRLDMEDASQRGSSSLREAAYLSAALEFGLPYYIGTDVFARLGSANIEQFLELCGDLMSKLITQDATGRPLSLAAELQDRVAREASRTYYSGLAQLPNGDLIQRFVDSIGKISQLEAAKPTIPYPPGVTGTALSMTDRARLRDSMRRKEILGAQELHDALISAIAHNVVWVELDYRVKNNRWMVIYVNRLLCPQYNMPLGLGGFRERKLSDMALWMVGSEFTEPPPQRTLL